MLSTSSMGEAELVRFRETTNGPSRRISGVPITSSSRTTSSTVMCPVAHIVRAFTTDSPLQKWSYVLILYIKLALARRMLLDIVRTTVACVLRRFTETVQQALWLTTLILMLWIWVVGPRLYGETPGITFTRVSITLTLPEKATILTIRLRLRTAGDMPVQHLTALGQIGMVAQCQGRIHYSAILA